MKTSPAISPSTEEGRITHTWQSIVICALLLFVGINLRSVILAVPPVLPLIKQDLNLSYTAVGLLTALPILMTGITAWYSGLLIERIGGRTAIIWGLILLALGTLLRAWISVFALFFFTVVLSIGIALSQTTAPVLVRRWFPNHIGLVTALFTDGLIIGETIGAGGTVPLMLLFLGKNNWVATFIFWGIPVVICLVLWLWLAPPVPSMRRPTPVASEEHLTSIDVPIAPEKKVSVLQLGLILGSGSLIYFGMNSWIASYNQAIHATNLTPLALTILNAAQLPSSFGVTFFAQRIVGRRWPFIAAGVVATLNIVAWVFAPPFLEYVWAALLGASSALVFTLGLALPPLLASPQKVARVTGATLSLSYSIAFIGPFIGGSLWDIFGLPAMAFVPLPPPVSCSLCWACSCPCVQWDISIE